MIDSQSIHREARLQGGVLVEVVYNHLRNSVTLDFDDHARVLVGFVTNGRDVGDDFLVHQLGDALDQQRAVHVVRDLGDDNLFSATFKLFDADPSTNFHAPAPACEVIFDPFEAAHHASGGKIWSLDVLH